MDQYHMVPATLLKCFPILPLPWDLQVILPVIASSVTLTKLPFVATPFEGVLIPRGKIY